jgi:hypothetical protein
MKYHEVIGFGTQNVPLSANHEKSETDAPKN